MRYAIWNNKGGVGKSFLSFVIGAEIANKYPDRSVILVDMCPQANLSEIVLGGNGAGATNLQGMLDKEGERTTIGGYFGSRINSPQQPTGEEASYLLQCQLYNNELPNNIYLIAGDPSLEIQGQVISQIGGQTLPPESWKNVHLWLKNLLDKCAEKCGGEEKVTVIIDCNPSFSTYTELAILASERLIVPCSSDGSSARALDNLGELVYGVSSSPQYTGVGFNHSTQKFSMTLPKISTIVLNRSTQYDKKASKAFGAMFDAIKVRAGKLQTKKPDAFDGDTDLFLEMPDAHSVAIVCSYLGKPLYRLSTGSYRIHGTPTQVNTEPLARYKSHLAALVSRIAV